MASEPQQTRWLWLDGVRGIAILAMAIYHLTWDLTFFHYVPADALRTLPFIVFGHSIACSFLAIAGFSLAIAAQNGLDWRKFIWRLSKITAAAALVTLATYFAFPESFVNFGILHCIAAASVMSVLFARLPWWTSALAGVAIFAAGQLIQSPAFNAVNSWIGLGQLIPLTNDWRPLFPWAGAMLLGLSLGQFALKRGLLLGSHSGGSAKLPLKMLALAGRHSLAIYLIHQPVLFGLVWLMAQAVPPHAQMNAPTAPFVQACARQCTNAGSDAGYCTRACSCIVRDAMAGGLWDNVYKGSMSADQQLRYDAIIAQCRRENAAKP